MEKASPEDIDRFLYVLSATPKKERTEADREFIRQFARTWLDATARHILTENPELEGAFILWQQHRIQYPEITASRKKDWPAGNMSSEEAGGKSQESMPEGRLSGDNWSGRVG